MPWTRRGVLAAFAATAAWAAGPRSARAAGAPRFVLIQLRGGLDGLATVIPVGDPDYTRQRGTLAVRHGLLPLDGLFALPPALAGLEALWSRGELLPLHAAHTPYRERSHFDGQDGLENGTGDPRGAADGWLYRALSAAGALDGALAFGRDVPLVLQGAEAVASVHPEGERVDAEPLVAATARLWADDPLLGPALAQGVTARAMVDGDGGSRRQRQVGQAIVGAARVLSQRDAVRVATLDVGGWDTHAGQGAEDGLLARRLEALGEGLVALRDGLGPAWEQTVVAVVTEFGRTVKPNGTRGTDHGTAGAAMLLGGAVRGGRVIADWPGLAAGDLHEGRDLRPTTDLRAALAGVLLDHLGLPERSVAAAFPGLNRPLEGLVR